VDPPPGDASRAAPAPPGRRRDALACGALFLLASLAVGGLAPFLDRGRLSALYYDDAFYYFQIARNVAQGHGFTFDGLHATNGFHPLWLFVLVPVFALVPGSVPPLKAVLALEALLVGVTVVVVFRTLRPRLGGAAAAAAALLVVAQPMALTVLRGGMESALLVCLLAVAWSRWLALPEDARPARWLELGGWCALLFLCRLEGIAAAGALLVLGRAALWRDLRRAAALLAPPVACAAAYLAWSRIAFGTWGPISTHVKRQLAQELWAGQGWTRRLLAQVLWLGGMMRGLGLRPLAAALLGLAVLAAIAVAVLSRPRQARTLVARAGAAFLLATAAVMVGCARVLQGMVFEWYRTPVILALAVVAGSLLHGRRLASRAVLAVAAVTCLLRAPQAWWYAGHTGGLHHLALRAADWLHGRVSPQRPAGCWGAGLVGYFAGNGVVNLDGFVNDAGFAREVVQQRALAAYLEREGIVWLVDEPLPNGRPLPLQHFPEAEARAVEARYRQVAAFAAACPEASRCPAIAVWEVHRAAGRGETSTEVQLGPPPGEGSSSNTATKLPAASPVK